MKKKVLLIILSLFLLTSCTKKDSKIFKEDYENMNGVMNSNGKIHREVHIPSENPIVISDAAEIVKMIENEESFYVYFGSKLCPWCRSVIEKAIEVANNNGIPSGNLLYLYFAHPAVRITTSFGNFFANSA